MKFSEYRRKRREEEQQAALSSKNVIPSVQYGNGSTQRTSKRFTDYMKERNPQGYNELQRRKAERTNDYIQQVNTHLNSNMDKADTARKSLLFQTGKYAPQEMSQYSEQYQNEQDAIRREAFELMRQSWSMGDAGAQARDAVKVSLANVVDAGKNISNVSDYMNSFEDKNSYEDAVASTQRKSAIERMSSDAIQRKIDETRAQLEGLQDHSLDNTALKGIKTLNGKDKQYQADKHSLENALHDYETALFSKQQSEALSKLNEESLEAFKKYRDFQAEGPGTAKQIMSAVGLYDGRAREQDRKALERDAKDALAKQGISEDEFDSLYEYYTFAYDADRAQQKAAETQQQYDDANLFGKVAMNVGTVLTAPVRGITAGAEALNALTYVNENAPLNINAPAYDLTNYSDTVRNATSQGIDNNVANFLYQTGMSIADMAAILPVSTLSGGASLALMGTNAGTEAAKMATQRGASKEQALMTGLAAGGAEVVFEKVSLDHFWDIAKNQGKAATKSMVANIFTQAGIEGTEEVATDLANMITDNLINGGYSEYHQSVDAYYKQGMSITDAQKKATTDFIMGLGQSFLGGAISGGVFGSVGAVQTAKRGKESTLTTDDYQRIVNTVNANEENGSLQDYDMQVRETALDLMTKGDKATAFQKGLFEEQLIRTGYANQNRDNMSQAATGDKLSPIEQIAADIPNKTIASAFVADYKQGMPIETYKRAFNAFYNCGYTDMSFEQSMEKGANFEAFIDRSTLYSIWALGQNQAKEVSKVYASQEQKELVQMTAKALGVEVEYQDMTGTNGMYKDGKLYIANQTINPSMVVLAHELTHDLKQTASAEYQQYEDYVINAFQEYHPQEYEALRKEVINQYGNDEAIIREEIVANASETFLTDADFVNKFVQENQSIAQRIVSFLDNFITKLRNLYKDYKAKGKAGKMLERDIETYTKARELWYEAVKNRQFADAKESDTRYYLKPYSEHQIQNWSNAKNIIVYESEEQFRHFIENPNEFGSKKMYLGVVSDYAAEKVKKELDIDIVGYNCVLGAYEIKKINKDHGTVATEAPRGQRPVITDDYLDIPYIMGKPDYVAKDFYNNQPAIKFQRDGATIFAVASGKHLNLYVQTMYVHKNSQINKKSLATAIDEQASINTSETTSGTAFDNIIADNLNNDNTKFSLKNAVEESKDLIALHNLNTDKFLKTLDLGGFPMPSIAITKSDIGHTNFGDISCVFYKDTIDPANKKNKVFGADAWTPTFPKIEYESDANVAWKIRDMVNDWADKLPEAYQNQAKGFVSGLEYSINSWGGYAGIVDEALRNTSMKAAYLVSKGESVSEIEKSTVTEMEPQQKEICRKLLDAYGLKVDDVDLKGSGKELYGTLGTETKEVLIRNEIERGVSKEEATAVVENKKPFQIVTYIRDALKYRENNGVETTTVIDVESMRKNIESRVDMAEYKAWLEKLFDGIEKNSGLWNGKEYYTASGNLRSFEQTHIPFNVQNIVEAMLKQSDDVRNVAGFNGTKTIRAVTTEDFKSIDEIKTVAGKKLKNINTTEYNTLVEDLDQRLYKVMEEIVAAKNVTGNTLIDLDSVGEIILETCTNPTAKNIKDTFAKYNRICTDAQAQEIADIVDSVSNMPVNMFEAKPLRVVEFSEVAAVVLPKGSSKELVKKISDYGMPIIEYERGNEEERLDIINNLPGVRFSRKFYEDEIGLRFSEKDDFDVFLDIINGTDDIDYDSVIMSAESAPESTTGRLIYDAGKILKEGIEAAGSLKDVNVTMDVARSLATHYLNQYNATFDEETLAENIFNIFAYIQKSENVNYNDMIRVMQEVCKPVLATSQMVDKDIQKQYNDMKKVIKSYNIRLNESQKAEVARVYDSYDRFRRLNQDKYVLREKGVYLDSIWSELVDASGGMLSYDVPDANQMLELHDFMMRLKDSMVSIDSEMNNSQLAYDMALNLYTDYFRVISQDKEIINNIRTQMQKKLTEYKKDVKREYKDQYKKALEEEQLRQQASIKRLQNQIKEITLERDEALRTTEGATIDILNGEIVKLEKRIEKMKESNLKKIATLNTKHRESLLGRAQRNEMSVVKNRIKKNMLDLQSRLAKPKENKYIPKQLVMATIDLCEAVNIDTGKSQKLAEHLQNLALVYERLKGDADYVLASEYDEDTHGKIRRLQTIFSGRNITVLNMEELYEVDKLVSQLKHQITNAAVVIGKENAKNIYEQAEQCMKEINDTEGVKGDIFHRLVHKYNTLALNAKRQFRRMSGYNDDSVLNQMYEDLNEGSHRQMQVLMETARMFDGVLSGGQQQKAVRNMVGQLEQDWVEMDINLHGVEPVKVPKAFRVSLAMHIQNKSNLDHIIYGGLTIPEPKAYQRGDYKTAYATGHTIRFIPSGPLTPAQRQEAYNFAVRKLNSAVAEMTPYEREFLRVSEQFFHRYTGEKINEVSLQLNGYKKAVVNKYFPIRTDSNFTHAELEGLVRNGSIEGMGFLNSRVGARNPILLEDITKVIQRQSENVAKYYGFAIPIRNFNKIYNTTTFGYRASTKSVIARKWGVEGQKYIEDLLVDIQSHRGQEGTFFDKLQGNFARAVLNGNLSVAAQQIVAYPTAAATLGWDAIREGAKYTLTSLDKKHIAKYTPLLWYRDQGTGAESEIGNIGKNQDAYIDAVSKLGGWFDSKELKVLAKVANKSEAFMKGMVDALQKIDTKAVGMLWKASEIFVEKQMKMSVQQNGEDAFYRQVAKVFNECVEDTQANYSTMQRPDILRNPNKFMKAFFLFKTQPLQNFGIIYDAIGNLRAKNEELKVTNLTEDVRKKLESSRDESAKTLARAVSSQLAAAGLIFALKFLAAAITHRVDKYRGDDGDLAADRILEEGFNEVMSSLSGSILFGSEIYNFIYAGITGEHYYGISMGVVDSLSDMFSSILKFQDDPSGKNLRSLIFDIGTVIGIPAENLYKTFNGLWLHGVDIINGEPLSFNAGYTGTMSAYYKVMYESLASGDSKEYQEVYDKALEQQLLTKTEDEAKSTITAGIKSKLKDSYIAGEISDEQALQILNTLGDDDAYFTIKAWDNADNEEYSKYSELEEAVRTGKNVEVELQELIDNGVKEKTAVNNLINLVREGWKDGAISDSEASKYLKEYKSDFTDDDVYWELRKWSKEDSYAEGESYSRYDDLVAAVENGTFDTVVNEYLEHGLEAKDIKRQISVAYKKQYMEAYNSKQYKLCNQIKDKLNVLKVNGRRLYGQPDYLDWNKDAAEAK